MKRQIRAKIAHWSILFLLIHSIGVADQPYPHTTTDANNPFVRLLVERYKEYHLSSIKGDVTAYEAARSREIIYSMRGHLTNIGKMDEYPSMIKRLAKSHVDLDEYAFYRSDRNANTARLIYERLNPKTQIAEYAVIMFRFEDNKWRVGPIGSIQTAGVPRTEQSPAGVPKPPILDDLLGQEQFRLPN